MLQRNDGTGESNILQNQFTAYLVISLRRTKAHYLQAKSKRHQYEISIEEQEPEYYHHCDSEFYEILPTIDQLEDHKLQQALSRKSKRDLYIFFARALEDQSFTEISENLGVSYMTVKKAYYRIVSKIKNELDGDCK